MLTSQTKFINLLHILIIALVGFLLTMPIISKGCLRTHDIWAHIVYSQHFSQQLWSGDFYPRWLIDMNAGLGSPTFFFYAPIPYYFTSLLSPLFINKLSVCNQLGVSSSIALIGSGITAYIWLKKISDKHSALIASILYMAWPYHLLVNLYMRFAFAEYWSFIWMPLILYFSIKIIRDSQLNIIGLSLSYSLLAMTHLPTFVIFFPVSIGYTLLMIDKQNQKKSFIYLVLSIIITIGLSAIYWLPALSTQKYISMDAILTGAYDYRNNFFFTGPKMGHISLKYFWRYLEMLTILTGILSLLAFFVTPKNSKAICRRESKYWMTIAMVSIFMMLPVSKPLWQVLPILQKIQHPFRFNSVLTLALVALVALNLRSFYIQVKPVKKIGLSIIVLVLISVPLAVIQLRPIQYGKVFETIIVIGITCLIAIGVSNIKKPFYFSRYKMFTMMFLITISLLLNSGLLIKNVKGLYKVEVDRILEISRGAAEHKPRWVPEEIFNRNGLDQLGNQSPKSKINVGEGNVLIKQWKPRKILLKVNGITDIWLTLHQFYYPGWTARIENKSQILPVKPSPSTGLLQVFVPSGSHEVSLTLETQQKERAGQVISAISVLLILFLIFSFHRIT